jgi:hypothetical protein
VAPLSLGSPRAQADLEQIAVAWALDNAEGQLRQEPAHRASDSERAYAWSLTAPNGDGHYIGAFSDRGEVIMMSAGDLWITFNPSGPFDESALRTLIRGS